MRGLLTLILRPLIHAPTLPPPRPQFNPSSPIPLPKKTPVTGTPSGRQRYLVPRSHFLKHTLIHSLYFFALFMKNGIGVKEQARLILTS